ncbi:hypothetical protein [Mucilaginibacter sp. OK268]|nr:hypothetical protein [Mucilaginibacter sp. OK268]
MKKHLLPFARLPCAPTGLALASADQITAFYFIAKYLLLHN